MKVVAGGFCFNPFPLFSFAVERQVAGIGRDRVLVFGFRGVMISIKSIDVSRRDDKYIESAIAILSSFSFFSREAVGRSPLLLVLVFAATCKEMALRPVLFDPKNKMSKLSMYRKPGLLETYGVT